jgi:hypothetical protein
MFKNSGSVVCTDYTGLDTTPVCRQFLETLKENKQTTKKEFKFETYSYYWQDYFNFVTAITIAPELQVGA